METLMYGYWVFHAEWLRVKAWMEKHICHACSHRLRLFKFPSWPLSAQPKGWQLAS
jgi:hypothetical protein